MACLIYTTFPNQDDAKSLAAQLLEQKLIACANILPEHVSLYEWEGEMKEESEVIVIFKTREGNFDAIREYIESHHSYDCPCVLKLSIEEGNEKFLRWIESNCE